MKRNHKRLFLVLAATLALVSLPTPSASQEDNTSLPLTYRAKTVEGSEEVCGPDDHRQRLQAVTRNDLSSLIRNNLPALVPCNDRNLGQLEHCPAASCSEILEQSPVLRPYGYYWITSSEGSTLRLYCDMNSTLCNGGRETTQNNPADSCSDIRYTCSSGYYWVRSSNGTAVQVYCDMDRVCDCSSTGGWTRVANLNMNNPSEQCPGEWTLQTRSSEPRRLCGRGSSGAGCLSAMYTTYNISYSHVCGRVIGYAYNSVDGFGQHAGGSQTIEGPYVDGISLTHGPPGTRQHIWTFAAGLLETVHATYPRYSCPCVSGTVAPFYVGNDYFCESGNPGTSWTYILYASDPLWDGQGCGSPPCCELSSPPGVMAPWFCKQLPQTTTDDIEIRICGDQDTRNEHTPVERIELYIR